MTLESSALSDLEIDRLPIADDRIASLPIVDLSGDPARVTKDIAEACRTWGMFYVIGHGIADDEIQACLAAMRWFFSQPGSEKRALSRSLENPWGYYDRELTKNIRDMKEVFDIGPAEPTVEDPFSGSTPWPPNAPEFRAAIDSYKARCEILAVQLVGLVFAGLGEAPECAQSMFNPASTSFLRLNSYPVEDLVDDSISKAGRAVHHHSDAGVITLLQEDGTPGLQTLRDGCWYDIPSLPGSLIINIGDMIQILSNDQYKAPVHRVLAMDRQQRYSAPFFCNPAYHALIAPLSATSVADNGPRYRPVPWAEFRRRRAEGDFGDYGKEVQIADYAA